MGRYHSTGATDSETTRNPTSKRIRLCILRTFRPTFRPAATNTNTPRLPLDVLGPVADIFPLAAALEPAPSPQDSLRGFEYSISSCNASCCVVLALPSKGDENVGVSARLQSVLLAVAFHPR